MRILLYRTMCDSGGVASWMQEHGRGLKALGLEPHFWFRWDSPRFSEFREIGPATIGDMAELVRAIEVNRYDVIHVSSSDGAAEVLSVLEPQPKIVATNRGALTKAWNARDCFARTAVSADMARLDQPYTDLLVEPILNGVDGSRFAPPSAVAGGKPIVAWVGRTTDLRSKDFPRFTRVANLLAASGLRFWVADAHGADWGRFSCPPCAKVEVERWERVSHAEMPGFYQAVAASGGAVLMTSVAEGFGWVAAEAAACGAGVLAPAVAGLRETVIDGVTGRLYPPAAADADVARIVTDWVAAEAGGLAGVNRRSEAAREAFSLARMTRQYRDVYRRERQLLGPVPAPAEDHSDPALAILLAQRREHHAIQSLVQLRAIRELLDGGRGRLAERAFRRMARRAPGAFLQKEGLRRGAHVAIRLVARRLTGR